MYPNGNIYFNYLDLQGDYSSATIGMQNQNASDAITMGYDNTDGLLDDSFSISHFLRSLSNSYDFQILELLNFGI